MYISDLELIFTDDASVSDWWDWNGVLGLNPFEGCEDESNSLDPQAPLNQLRGNYSGFVLDYTRLIFTNERFHGFKLPLDGMYFEMKEILFGDYNFGGVRMKGKLDLESRYIKVPARYFDELWKEFGFLYEQEAWYEDKAKRYIAGKRVSSIQIAITSPLGQRKTLKLPLRRYWESGLRLSIIVPPIQEWQVYVESAFIKHEEPYWSFGLLFLEDFRVYWDLKRRRIGFESRYAN